MNRFTKTQLQNAKELYSFLNEYDKDDYKSVKINPYGKQFTISVTNTTLFSTVIKALILNNWIIYFSSLSKENALVLYKEGQKS